MTAFGREKEKMNRFNPKSFARRIREAHPDLEYATVRVMYSDLPLVIQVYDTNMLDLMEGNGNIIAHHDTGLDGDEEPAEADELADALCEALCDEGVYCDRG